MKRSPSIPPDDLSRLKEKAREIPWKGLFHDPDMIPAERLDEELTASWADDIDRDR